MSPKVIPVCEPMLAGNELRYVQDAVQTGWISSGGHYGERLEKEFAAYLGVKHAITASNGTAALHLALVAAGVGPEHEVIVPTFTMIASAFSVCYTGAKPVFVDCDPATWCIDPAAIEAAITSKTKAIMPVHIYGHACEMDAIREIAARKGVAVIEDAAEAIGSEYKGKKCGALSDVSAFSLFANKAITTGEGGLVATDRDDLAERCRYFKNLCFPARGPRVYVHEEIGFNYRLPNTLAAIGVAQLEKVDHYVSLRRRNAALYKQRLEGVRGVTLQPERAGTVNSYWMYSVLIEDDFGLTRDQVVDALREQCIETRRFFVPMHVQPSLVRYCKGINGQFPVADRISPRGLYLPSGGGLTEADLDRVCETLKGLRKSRG